MRSCFLFPGQGAQYPGMGKDLWESSKKVKELFDCAADTTGIDVQKLLFQGTEEELKATENTQVAVTLVNLSASLVLKEKGIDSDGCAGFSLGEFAALVEAEVLSQEHVFPLVKARGTLMQEASGKLDSSHGGAGMAAVMGLAPEKIEQILGDLGGMAVYVANYNSPKQIVLSGTAQGLDEAEQALKKAGARRFIRLKVSGPFHSPLLAEAAREFETVLREYTFKDPIKPLYSNVTGKKVDSASQAQSLCVKQITSSVQWVEEERAIVEDGFERVLEVGPGRVLAGLWKTVSKEVNCFAAGTLTSMESIE